MTTTLDFVKSFVTKIPIAEIIIYCIAENQETKGVKKLNHKEGALNLNSNLTNKKSTNKITPTRKQASLSSMPSKSSLKVKSEFIIPELPSGRLIEMKIYTNWGDKYFVGLNGVELFDSQGNPVGIEKVSPVISNFEEICHF